MRLMNTLTGKLKDFRPDDAPPYAILSHTWGDNEQSFQDVQNVTVALSLSPRLAATAASRIIWHPLASHAAGTVSHTSAVSVRG